MSGSCYLHVAVRLSPENEDEKSPSIVDIIKEKDQVIVNKDGESNNFTFNHVFLGKTTQSDVYNNCVKPLIGNILKGYNVSIVAYGYTGTGKTYTMGTHYNPHSDMGVIPRSIIEVFDLARDHFSYDCKITVSFFEVFNEIVYDLLARKPKEQCIIDCTQENTEKGFHMSGITEIPANSAREVLNLLQIAVLKRACESTPISVNSSRSHALFTLNIDMTHKTDKNENKSAKLLLVDLAAAAENTDLTNKNGVNIPKNGILALNNVVNHLVCDESVDDVPYEDSNLTRLLKDAFGGNSKTLVIACVNPSEKNSDETISTLKMAIKMKKIKNQPMIQQVVATEEVIEPRTVSERSQNYVKCSKTSLQQLVLTGLSKIKKQMLEIIDERRDFQPPSSPNGNHIKHDLDTNVSGILQQTTEFKEVEEHLADLEKLLENITEKFKIINQRVNDLEEERDLLKENIIASEITTDKKNKTAKRKKTSKNQTIKRKLSESNSISSITKIENLLEKSEVDSTHTPCPSKVTVRKQKARNDENQPERKTITKTTKANGEFSEVHPVEATNKSRIERKVLTEKRKNYIEEESSVDNGRTKEITMVGCCCTKSDCSRKYCRCKKNGNSCDLSCKCKQSVCRNRIKTDNSLDMNETEQSVEEDSFKRKKTSKENVARKKKVR